MKLLVLGGGIFLGRHAVAAAFARGHDVTVFTRGRTNPELHPEAEHLVGDRDGGLDALRGRSWDAVIDTSGFVPRVVRQSVELLADAAGVYAFISSGSVYPLESDDRSENGPVIQLDDPAMQDVGAGYGGLKALCEDVVSERFGERALNVRSGLIVGPHDPTGRFTYWPVRLPGDGGEVLAPGEPDREVQFIDARDEVDWILDMADAGRGGTFNVTGPAATLTLGELLARCGDAPLTWADDQFLLDQSVQPYMEMPLWIPPSAGTLNMPIDRALTAGLRFRHLDETIRDTREWAAAAARDPGPPLVDGAGRVRVPQTMKPDRERELLRLWHERGG
jgi:2'-hydroxyisoflavone reductase